MSDRDHAAVTVSDPPFAGAANRIDELLYRCGLRGETLRDCALGVLVAALSVGLLWASLTPLAVLEGVLVPRESALVLTVVLTAQSLLLCLRRSRPLLCVLGVTSLQVLIVALLPAGIGFQGLALFVAVYTCGTRLAPFRLAAVLLSCVLVHAVAGGLAMGRLAPSVSPLVPGESDLALGVGFVVSGIASFVVPALFGAYVGTRRRYVELLRTRAAEEARAQHERLENVVRAERTRMARELHDIAAHHLSGMVVQAGAAERLVGRDDQAAREAMNWVRTQGRETLDSLRLVVGALRDPGEETEGLRHRGEPGARGAPVPGLAALDRLVAAERELGTALEVTREGEPYPLPPIADVTAYRVVQESLSNARDHARGAPVRMALRYEPSRVALEVENGPGGTRDTGREHRGLGVLGMRERAQVVGAALETGPTGAGGWRVRWEVPVERDERRSQR
ncbi:sensor histidine kinase [Nocardiopsis ganjiahuensis]|uniref:sensor histidine kinase n=1 Tax=Nocardiopsis ganjiahuensis TaxID=239984 RepID=UPI00034D054F|nr:histidine kinase [Nocardiopsis ganjiahuensis]